MKIVESVSSRDTFSINQFFKNYERCPNIIPFFCNYGRCLFKRHLQHKFKIFHCLNGNCGKCLLNKHFQYKPNIFKIVEGIKRHISQFPKNGIILKVSLEETPSIILKKNGFILKVSLEETLSTIFIH